MTRRLLLSYLGLALLILIVLEVPLAVLAARHDRDLASSQAQRVATGLAVAVGVDIEDGRDRSLAAVAAAYRARTGGEVEVVTAGGRVLASSDDDGDNDAVSTDAGLVHRALSGSSTNGMISDEGGAQAVAAVPVGSGARPEGVVLLALPAGSTTRRIHEIWLALVGFAAVVMVLTALLGRWVARSLTRPLGRLEATVGALGPGELAVRAAVPRGPPEVRSLARQFNRMATGLNELVDAQTHFVADASHQLRSPLTALRLRLENLEEDLTGSPHQAALAAAHEEVLRLSRLVDGLLALSRADRTPPLRSTVDVDSVIGDRCRAWNAYAEERRVDVERTGPVGHPVLASLVPGDLDQILDNLLANALNVAPSGSRIDVALVHTPDRPWEIHVVDKGPGMDEDDRRRAFDRFWQGPGSRGHSGLGLAIVRQLTGRNGADVVLAAAPGGGLDATVLLPDGSDRGARTPA